MDRRGVAIRPPSLYAGLAWSLALDRREAHVVIEGELPSPLNRRMAAPSIHLVPPRPNAAARTCRRCGTARQIARRLLLSIWLILGVSFILAATINMTMTC